MKKNLLILMSLLFSFAFGQEEWRSMNTENSDIPSNTTISLGITAADDIYIGTPGGLVDPSHVYSFDQDVWTETEWISSFNTMKSSPQNHLVVATGEGLFHYANGEYSVFNMDNSNLTSNNITCMDVAADGTEYIGMSAAGLVASGGLGIYDGSFWAVYNSGNSIMPVDNVSAVFISQTGNLWFSPSNQGLIKKNGDDWVLFNTENSDIPGNFVLCMTESADAVLWVAFSNGSIATTTDGSSWDIIKHEEAKDFPNSNASSMLLDAQGKIWISFENGGIAGFNGTDWVFHTALTTPLPSDYITNMVLDSNGDIWISSFQDGLSIFDPDFGAGIDDDIWTENTRTYPNPVQNYLTIESKTLSSNAYVIVYNVMGQILMQEALVDLKQNIDCQGLSNGFYTYQIIQEKMITSGVFIKK